MDLDSMHTATGSSSSSSSLLTPSSDYSSSTLGSASDRKNIEGAIWSDPVTPLKTSKDKEASLLIDSGYAGEQPSGGGGGDRSVPFSKWKFTSRVTQYGSQGSCESPLKVYLDTDGISLVVGILDKKGLLPWVVTMLLLASTCFSLLYFDRTMTGSYSNGKYEAIKFGAEHLVTRLQREGRWLIEVRDDMGNQLGGKKAAMQFVHESIHGKVKLANFSLDVGGSKENDKVGEKENSFDDLWKLSEELKTLEAALESLQGKEITSENAREVRVAAVDKAENREKEVEEETRSEHGTGKTEASNYALGEIESDAKAKDQLGNLKDTNLENIEVIKGLTSPNTDVSTFEESSQTGKDENDEKSSQPRSKVRLTEKGMKGRRKSLAGLRDEI